MFTMIGVKMFVGVRLPQEGVDTVGVWRSPELDEDDEEEVVMFTMIGVKMFVGVRPVRPSMRALKSSWFITLVGVSMGMFRLLRLFDPLPTRTFLNIGAITPLGA